MQFRQPLRSSLRRALVGVAALSALVPVAAKADATPDLNTLITMVVQTVPDATVVDTALGAASKNIATCVIQTSIDRTPITAQGADSVSCGNVVTSTTSHGALCDDVLGWCADSAWCTGTNQCQNTTPPLESPITNAVTLTVSVTAKARSGYGWASPPPKGCSISGATLSCTVMQHDPGLSVLGPIVPVI